MQKVDTNQITDGAEYIDALSPKSFEAAKARYSSDPVESWCEIADALNIAEDVERHIHVDDPARAFALALFEIPIEERHALSRQHPFEIIAIAGAVWANVTNSDPVLAPAFFETFNAPEVFSAFRWWIENRPDAAAKAYGLEVIIH